MLHLLELNTILKLIYMDLIKTSLIGASCLSTPLLDRRLSKAVSFAPANDRYIYEIKHLPFKTYFSNTYLSLAKVKEKNS